ncbi:MAG TPA: hypothetical protein VFQ53_33555 [Kofleriaceae bacterium]|nr:hypothetical protein [Kofleriaceae bacterium]
MSAHHEDELPTLELAMLENVTGGAADMSAMLPMMMMMRGRRSQPSAPPPPPTPKVTLNGVEQRPSQGPNGLSFNTET